MVLSGKIRDNSTKCIKYFHVKDSLLNYEYETCTSITSWLSIQKASEFLALKSCRY